MHGSGLNKKASLEQHSLKDLITDLRQTQTRNSNLHFSYFPSIYKWMQRGKGLSKSLFLEITSFIRGSDEPRPEKSITEEENQLPRILLENSNTDYLLYTQSLLN